MILQKSFLYDLLLKKYFLLLSMLKTALMLNMENKGIKNKKGNYVSLISKF